MYTDFYRLTSLPFQLGPDPRFFFGSKGHQKAMAYLTYGLSQGEGFIVITGEVGAGKTTIIERLFETLDPNKVISAKVVTTLLDSDDLVRMVAGAFGIASEGLDKAVLMQRIESFLRGVRTSGRRALLVVDEVQNLSVRALEELRMLSNFQVDRKTLLQSFLVGQPEFRATIASEELEQLRQRVIASYHLGPLSPDELQSYVEHRLRTAGWQNDPEFAPGTMALIHQHTGGVPRLINTLCSRLLLFGYLEELHRIDERAVNQVAEELTEELFQTSRHVGLRPRLDRPAERYVERPAAAQPAPVLQAPANANGIAELDQRITSLEEQFKRQDLKLQRALTVTSNLLERMKQ